MRKGRHPRGDRSHGVIESRRFISPTSCEGTDVTRSTIRRHDGWCWFFWAVDHCVSEVVGWHVAKKGDRWASSEPIRQGVRTYIERLRLTKIALGLEATTRLGSPVHRTPVRMANSPGSAYARRHSYVGEPECTGVIDRFIRYVEGRVPLPARL